MYDDDGDDQGGATQVFSSDDPLTGMEWSVNLTEDETVVMKAHEIAWEVLRGTLDPEDVFVWRDGMDDWVPIGACAEIQRVVAEYQSGQSGAPQGASAPDFGATVMMDMLAHEEAEHRSERAPARGPALPAADHPLAGTMIMDTSQDDVGQSHEASRTLASPLAHLEASRPVPAVPPRAPPPSRRAPPPRRVTRDEPTAAFPMLGIPGAPSPSAPRDPLSDLGSLAPEPLGGGVAAAFEPPLSTPRGVLPNAPTQPAAALGGSPFGVAPVVAPGGVGTAMGQAPAASVPPTSLTHPAVLAAQLEAKPKSSVGLIVGAAAAVALLTVGVVTFMVVRNRSADASTLQASAASVDADAPTRGAPAGDDSDGDASDATAKDGAPPPTDASGAASSAGPEGDAPASDSATALDGKQSPTPGPTTAPTTPVPAEKKVASPEPPKEEPKVEPAGEFNRDAARAALDGAAARASGCAQKNGPTGRGRVTVTFSPNGKASQASVGPPFAGTPVGSCAVGAFKAASVPPFSGGPVTVSKSFFIK